MIGGFTAGIIVFLALVAIAIIFLGWIVTSVVLIGLLGWHIPGGSSARPLTLPIP